MAETSFSWSQIESPAAGARLAPGLHVVRGWVLPKSGGVIADVRARIGSRVFAGVYGIPRADVAAHFSPGQPIALAEFEIAVVLEPGDDAIELDALELEGRWSAFEVVSVTVDSTLPHVETDVPLPPLSWLNHVRIVEAVLRHADGQASPDWPALAREVVAALPWPRELRPALSPFIGFVDEPVALTCSRFGRIPAFGHLFHSTQKIARLFATADLQFLQPISYGQPSPGPAAFYTQQAHATDCGFLGYVDVPSSLPNPVALRLYAELEDGSLHLAFAVRANLHSQETEKTPLAATHAEIVAAIAAVDGALAATAIPVSRGEELTRGLAELEARATRSPSRVRRIATPQPAPAHLAHPLPRTVVVATHGLTPQGAPRFLLDLARALVRAGVGVHVVSAGGGPLRVAFEQAGARVTALDLSAAFSSGDFAGVTSAIDWASADLVIANTFTTFWAVHAAQAVGRPSLLYIHESTAPADFYGARVPPAVIALAEEGIARATAVSFTTAATARYHGGTQWLTPGWIDVAALDAWRIAHPRETSRARLVLRPDELLVVNIGTVSDRKGQHAFVRAVDLLWRRNPELAARARFVLLGGRDTLFDTLLGSAINAVNRPNLAVHPETIDYLDYYQAADVFACSSYEESSPRVVLEAMAMGVPILANAVQGIPELVRPDLEAQLVAAGDTAAWGEALVRLLASSPLRGALAARARARVVAEFEAGAVLPRHLALIAQTAAARVT